MRLIEDWQKTFAWRWARIDRKQNAMANFPLVSIGMPVYNGERFLRSAIESLLAQSYRNIEIVVCDNASVDDTALIAREFVSRDQRVRYHRNSRNSGALRNFNLSIELARGEYFMWAAHDDIWEPHFVSEMLSLLHSPAVSLAFCRFDNIDEFGSVLRRYNLRPLAQSHVELGLRRFLIQDGRRGKANLIYGLMRTKMIRDIGGFRLWNPLEYAVDMNQVFRILTCGQLALSNSLLFHKRLSPSEAAWLNACGSASMGSKKVHVDIDTWRRVVSMFDGYGKALSDSSLDIDTKRRLSRIIVRQKRKLKRQLGVAISAMIWYRIKGAARQTFVGKGLVRARRWLTGS